MEKKTITFLIASNRKGATRSVVISAAWLKAGLALTAVGLIVSMACIVDYLGLLSQTVENKRLKVENKQLKEQFQVVEGKLNSLETGLERVKGFVTKLRLITAVGDEDRTLKLAIGPLPRTGEALRDPASVMGTAKGPYAGDEDAVFYQKPPADPLQGELTVEGQRDYASLAVRIDQAVADTHMREQSVLDLWETLSERQSLMSATPSIRPSRGWFTSKFGYRVSPFTGHPVMHN